MSYLLDTNVCIKLLNNSSIAVTNRLATRQPQNIFICTVVAFELYYGAYRSSRQEQNLGKLERFLNEFTLLVFDKNSANIAGKIRRQLEVKGTPIGGYDLQIAAIAMANNLTLVTHNIREFRRIDGLLYEDWEEFKKIDL